jgi:hypothetical protein
MEFEATNVEIGDNVTVPMNWKMVIPFIFFYAIGPCIGANRHLKMNGEIFGTRGI